MILDSLTVDFSATEVISEWITLASYADPQGEWGYYITDRYNPVFAYNGSITDSKMAMSKVLSSNMNMALYGDFWGGWLELFPSSPILCDAVRAAVHIGGPTGNCNMQIQLLYNSNWNTVYQGPAQTIAPYWHTVNLPESHITSGVRIRFERRYLPDMDYLLANDIYEIELHGIIV